MFRDRSEHRLKHSESTVLTSANPQLQAEVFVSTAALELACQQDRIFKKAGARVFGASSEVGVHRRLQNMNHSRVEAAASRSRRLPSSPLKTTKDGFVQTWREGEPA